MLEVCERADNTPIAATPIIGDEPLPRPVVEEDQIAVRMESSFVVGWFQHVLPRLKKEILLANTAHKGPLPAVLILKNVDRHDIILADVVEVKQAPLRMANVTTASTAAMIVRTLTAQHVGDPPWPTLGVHRRDCVGVGGKV